ncbi:SprT family protein [Halobacillus shinanisalinarum]|uniref:SprT family protein n=1 Tax=Halobacillus shinanisalinarum TaxID=2932258 RepID=A0ABY4H9M0_9BACI|nr:SprT family protein [Halobacillus shinanisalinarum]UOQ95707.1 SprT family protein [Halobacillus shinanisalinarum]
MSINQQHLQKWTNRISQEFFGKPYVDHVTFNPRLRTTGGRYIPSKRVIELNPKYLMEMNEEEFVGIIKHELCHYHLHIEGKGFAHKDRAFKELLKKTGSPRHCKPLPSEEKKKHVYICTHCANEYVRRKRINIEKYRCGKCMGELKKS